MALTIRKLRAVLLVATVALLAVIVGYVGYARHRFSNYVKGLPGQLGLDITTDGFKYSHALGADTEFTVKAKRQIKHQDGKMTLYGVGIVVYGAKADRSDRISGEQFEYDQKTGELRGIGDVLIDLQAPATDADKGAMAKKDKTGEPKTPKVEDESKVIHVKTRGLVFQEKERSASTDERVDFVANGMTGNSVGASYDSKNGVVILKSAVHLSGLRDEHPVAISAGRAEMDRDGHVAKLEGVTAVLETDNGARTLKADHAVVHVRKDGNPERVDGAGHVVLTGDGKAASQSVATGDRMQMDLNDKGQPEKGFLAGNVRLTSEAPQRREDGRGDEVQMLFDGTGRPVHSVMTGAVEMNVHEAAGDRKLNAAKVDLDLGGGGKEPVFVKGAVATGPDGARLKLAGKDKKGSSTASGMRADVIVARFGDAGSRPPQKVKNGIGPPLVGLDGRGKTFLEQVVTDDKGAMESKQTSTGETLKVDFRTGDDGKVEMTRTEQRGGVAIVRELQQKAGAVKAGLMTTGTGKAAKADGLEVEHVKADAAVYVADSKETTLTGDVQVQDAESVVFADKVVSDGTSGDSTAEGAVKVSYLQQGSTQEPMHVLAGRAVSHKASGMTEFFAGPGARVKMWQGGSQVEAPVLDYDKTKKTLVAKDVAGSNGVVVRSVIVDNSAPKPEVVKAAGSPGKKQGSKGPMRVLSEEMIYTDAARLVEFKGKVRAEDADGVMHAQDALVYLTPNEDKDKSKALRDDDAKEMALGGKVDHMVATGAVELDQPGRKASGEKLTYAASDQTFVLTGTKAAPPKMMDELQGTTTGDSLRFRTGDDSVVISSGEDAGKVRSETRLKQGAKGTGKKP